MTRTILAGANGCTGTPKCPCRYFLEEIGTTCVAMAITATERVCRKDR